MTKEKVRKKLTLSTLGEGQFGPSRDPEAGAGEGREVLEKIELAA